MPRDTERVGMIVTRGTVARLRALAKALGYVAPNGMMVGQGSLSALFEAIASGALQVTRTKPDAQDAKRE